MKLETRHLPVLLNDVLRILDPRPGKTIVDCTLGLGGHSSELLRRILPGGKLLAIDFDPANIALARAKLKSIDPTENSFQLFHNNFAALPTVLLQAGTPANSGKLNSSRPYLIPWELNRDGSYLIPRESVMRADAILADLGVASPQIDDPARGFSYRKPGPLDMRMDPTRGQIASNLIARLSERELSDAFLELGDETDAPQIARLIVARRKIKPITTTEELMAIICEARDFTIQRAAGAKLHPAARTFQALRILVNREMANLERLLAVLPDSLQPGGVAAIISFHSGEDRRVKESFKEHHRAGIYSEISRDPIIASEDEIKSNARSRSAKLRWARKTSS